MVVLLQLQYSISFDSRGLSICIYLLGLSLALIARVAYYRCAAINHAQIRSAIDTDADTDTATDTERAEQIERAHSQQLWPLM